MLGFENMIKSMLQESGIDISEIQRMFIEGYQRTMAFIQGSVNFQNDMVRIAKSQFDLQRLNAAKLDAIIAHLGIEINEEKTDGQQRIEFKQSDSTAGNTSAGN